jgi:hypothetical protein
MFCAAAALVLAAGILVCLRTASRLAAAAPVLRGRRQALRTLHDLHDLRAPYLAARRAYAELQPPQPPAFEDLLRVCLPELKPDDVRQGIEQGPDGWQRRRKDVTFRHAEVGPVLAFAARAEQTRPPWILTRCSIRSAPHAPGTGQVALTFETVERP